jgi:hypothetical protein
VSAITSGRVTLDPMRRTASLAVLALALALAGCDNPAEPRLVTPIQVDHVDVLVMESFPAQAAVHVQGVVGDGCSRLESVEQRREGNTVVVTILATRPREAICTQIALLYDEQIRLEGHFPPGTWRVRVNGVERTFTT